MTPNPNESSLEEFHLQVKRPVVSEKPEKIEIVYVNVFIYSAYHIFALYGLYLSFTSVKWPTIILGIILWTLSILGTTMGSHRLWSHRAYKANLPLQIFLMICTSIACQLTSYNWVRDHRMHHKYSDTNADPHNAKRGFFFSHMGWLLIKKHTEMKRLGNTIYMDDVHSNPVLMFQKKYAIPFMGSLCFIIPVLIPIYFWNESFVNAWNFNILRFILGVHSICSINSFAHLFGTRPYDENIMPVENIGVSLVTLGEGFHNYHHSFPWDYKAGELGNNWLNFSTATIDFFAKLGWAYDLKTASDAVVEARIKRTGDGTYKREDIKESDRGKKQKNIGL
ncbi:PREDICTED: acyl-CoA Delta(11) desaturase-like [Papilio xuthus]|uniref:Acyl-CoA Delta(11) desaturase n=1 Tax=Papilio xuthus TaxID=66420 RepID=A0A194QB86_PAPXU|nr:PREDICTED: acyl-CoA Delta(11) desaturase-like [Papilio xuthus]KPJ02255.1 Acyl-CoA Delta(11) desaturase [Papilio xuthus]